MTDKRSLNDQDVINLLDRLKSVKSEYPANLKTRRRAIFLSSIAAGSFLSATKPVGLAHAAEVPMSTAMKVAIAVLTTAAIAVTTSLGVLAYQNREILAERLFGKTPTIAYSSPVPASGTPLAPMEFSISPTSELTPSPTSTLIDILADGTPVSNTSVPGIVPTDDNGLHLGNTPHPGGTPPGQSTGGTPPGHTKP